MMCGVRFFADKIPRIKDIIIAINVLEYAIATVVRVSVMSFGIRVRSGNSKSLTIFGNSRKYRGDKPTNIEESKKRKKQRIIIPNSFFLNVL